MGSIGVRFQRIFGGFMGIKWWWYWELIGMIVTDDYIWYVYNIYVQYKFDDLRHHFETDPLRQV